MTGGTGKGSDGLANLRGLNHWVLQAFKVGGADLWYRATMVLPKGQSRQCGSLWMKSGRIHRAAVAQARAPHFYPGGLVCEPAHYLTCAGPLQFHGEHMLLAVLHNSTWAQDKLLKGEFAAFPLGKALGGPAPTAHAVGQDSGNAALFESRFPPW